MSEWLMKFQSAVRRIDSVGKEPVAQDKKQSKIQYYSLIKIFEGVRTPVGFRMLHHEAVLLSNVLARRMRRLSCQDDSGVPMFEITQSQIEKELI